MVPRLVLWMAHFRSIFAGSTLIAGLALVVNSAYGLEVTVTPVNLSAFSPQQKTFGKLVWRGGLRLVSMDKRFGGFSGLVLSGNGRKMVAVSDRGWWLTGKLQIINGMMAGAGSFRLAPVKTDGGKRARNIRYRDVEALAPWDERMLDGYLVAGFERHTRILRYAFGRHATAANPKAIRFPKDIGKGPYNRTIEAISRFYSGPYRGWMIAISERGVDKGKNLRGWLWRAGKTIRFSVSRHQDYDVTGMALAPDGKSFFTIERSFNPPLFPGMALRRFKATGLAERKILNGEVLFSGRQPVYAIDNMEGIAVHRGSNGKLRLTVISDDNYNRNIQRTLLFQFEIGDSR